MRRSGQDFPRLWLATPRLTLRPLQDDDLDQIAALLGDADALVQWGPPLDRDGARDWILRNRRRYQTDSFGRCAIELAGTHELIGDCGLIRTTVEGIREVELGWIVRRTHWGRGYATEAAAAWRDFAFEQLGLARLVSIVAADNVASRRVAEKLGMTVERSAIWGGAPMLMYAHADPCAARVRRLLGADRSEPSTDAVAVPSARGGRLWPMARPRIRVRSVSRGRSSSTRRARWVCLRSGVRA